MIAESLAGKRIAITGSTGFVGTALVERLLRSVPGCELVLLVRDGKRTPAARRVQRELLKNDAFDRLRAEHGAGVRRAGRRRASRRSPATSAPTGSAWPRPTGPSSPACDIVIHSAATVSFDSPLDSAVEINLLGPTRIAALLDELGVTPHLVSVSTCYVAGNRRGTAPEELVSAGPFDLGLSWRAEVAAARRLRGDAEAASRDPAEARRVPVGRPHRARRRRGAGARRQDRAAPRALGPRPPRRGRPGPCRQRRLARRLRLHQGARRAGAHRLQGRRAGQHRAPVDHRVGVGRAAPGLDPRLPHGRAGAHLLRPGPAARVPRRARGHRRRHPRRPRRRRDHHRRRPRPGRGAGRSARSPPAGSTR